jgi:hypothetical protein
LTQKLKKLHIKNVVVKSMTIPHQNIHKYTWNSPDGKSNYVTVHILIDRWHSSTLDVRSLRAAACDTDHYLVVAKDRERLAVSKSAAQTFVWGDSMLGN